MSPPVSQQAQEQFIKELETLQKGNKEPYSKDQTLTSSFEQIMPHISIQDKGSNRSYRRIVHC